MRETVETFCCCNPPAIILQELVGIPLVNRGWRRCISEFGHVIRLLLRNLFREGLKTGCEIARHIRSAVAENGFVIEANDGAVTGPDFIQVEADRIIASSGDLTEFNKAVAKKYRE